MQESNSLASMYWQTLPLTTRPALLAILMLLGSACSSTMAPEEERGVQLTTPAPDSQEISEEDDLQPTVVAYREYRDPLMPFNRAMFRFNDVTYRYALIPLAKGYNTGVPTPVRRSVGNAFHNIRTPIYVVNSLLQLDIEKAGINLARFGLNSTLGLLGLFDVAERWFDMEREDTTFNDTLAHYGVGYGTYLVLPFLGSTDLRNGTSALTELVLHPIGYLVDGETRLLVQGFDYFQQYAPAAAHYTELLDQSDDPYLYMRNMYLQGVQRDARAQQSAREDTAREEEGPQE